MFIILMGPIVPILYWMIDKSFVHLPKLAYYPAVVVIVLSLVRSKFLLDDWLIKILIIYSVLLFFFGLSFNALGKATFAHLFSLFLPVVSFSFGYLLVKRKSVFFEIFESKMISIGIVLSLFILVYYLLFKSGYLSYFGASSLISIPILYALVKKRYIYLSIFLCALFFTGKRTVILGVLLVMILYFLWLNRSRAILLFSCILLVVIAAITGNTFVVSFFPDAELLGRFSVFFQEDVDWNLATSGRLNDVIAAITSINQNGLFWLVGKGVGATFIVDYGWGADLHSTHYTHISPVSYVFLGGVLLAAAVYLRLISLFIHAIKNAGDFYSLLFIYYFIVSFSGAILFTDPFVWVVAGIVFYNSKNRGLTQQTALIN